MTIAIGCDDAALALKDILIDHLRQKGVAFIDVGVNAGESTFYPDIAARVAQAVTDKTATRGILVCGTGIGMSITANKFPGIRAAQCHDCFSAERAILSNNAQILCMGERVIGSELAKKIVDSWLAVEYVVGRSEPKVQRMRDIDSQFRASTAQVE
ncbi:ribose 5-phosphate isomerase B [Alginatibacterium sediminis]|uniref:Ribose 5-phosphate isomerase B n=1 Tax=Alginatibacterium sediminis TaxID=2164068 RepID=A0A420EHU6_9ALTE|nr:ribose 5-phosphate isomerase B [Alginatibacterium sediminis]RKF20292.1 ribose 5-phosphate isomerase B [Alginatibacterium sediminis]